MLLSRLRACALLCAIFSALSPDLAHAQQMLLTADTEIDEYSPTLNLGSSAALAVNPTSLILLKFDLSNLPPGITASQVNEARLILFADQVTTPGQFVAYQLTSAWTESSTTFATRPNYSKPADTAGTLSAVNTWASLSVLTMVKQWITTPSSNYGVMVKSHGGNFLMDSKENAATSHPAMLLISLNGPAGPQGPAGPAGAPGGGLTSISHDSNFTGTGVSGSPLELSPNLSVVSLNSSAIINSTTESDFSLYGENSYYDGTAVGGRGTGSYATGVYAEGFVGIYSETTSSSGYAAEFEGNVSISGNLSKSGGSFKIDDPIDPANKYLLHSFVESPDMKNIYDGNIVTDASGTAVVTMPEWFDSLNRDFRYQLTAIGQFAQAIVASKMNNRQFVIKTDKPNVEVSWQVTGIRQDAWANAHRIPVEEEKSQDEKGHFLHPELFNHTGEPAIGQRTGPGSMHPVP